MLPRGLAAPLAGSAVERDRQNGVDERAHGRLAHGAGIGAQRDRQRATRRLRHARVACATSQGATDDALRRLHCVVEAEAERQRVLLDGVQTARISPSRMIRIAITVEAFDAIKATLPVGSVAFEARLNTKGEREIWLEPHVVNKLRRLRGPGESYSDVILRLANG
jgi:hypothetical protein